MNRLVLLDRDGTINVEKHYLSSPGELVLLNNAAHGIRRLNELGLRVVIVTNQSAIGRGLFDETQLADIHRRLLEMLDGAGARIDAVYYCPHQPDDGCACRKPKPGLAQCAAHDWGAELSQAFVIGDKVCDIELGKQVGATTFLVETGYGAEVAKAKLTQPDFIVPDLLAAAGIIEKMVSNAHCPKGMP